MLPKIIRTGIHRYKGTGVRKTQMATQYRKAYVPVTLDVDKEGAILSRGMSSCTRKSYIF